MQGGAGEIREGTETMLLNHTKEYDCVWGKVEEILKFKPSSSYRGHSMTVSLPFEIDGRFAVYGIEKMTEEQMDIMDVKVREVLISVTQEGGRMYALDWNHSAFLFDPRYEEKQMNESAGKYRHWGDGYDEYFPDFYPDGDYYFFIDEDFRFGYLGHPWRQEIWVFGDVLIEKMEQIYQDLGWIKIH